MKKTVALVLLLYFYYFTAYGQQKPTWDDTSQKTWNPAFEKVEIPSTKDGKIQYAYMYKSSSKRPQPLIVSLHTWSGSYNQADPLTKEIMARDWNYIHPDFRGANRTSQAMVSEWALSDIEDAIQYALKHTHADPEDVHVIGVSGGGLATLAAYMNLDYPVKSFSAWAPISDIEAWYWESVGRKQKYANDILKAIPDKEGKLCTQEAVHRSPLYQVFPIEKRKNAHLYIYEGVHDGYTGSVPITHSLNMYNRLVGELKYKTSDMGCIMQQAFQDSDLVSPEEIISLVAKRINPHYKENAKLFDRHVHLYRKYRNISLTLFEGRHEQIPQALGLLPCKQIVTDSKYSILVIGDSNAEKKGGWVDQMRKMMPKASIVNLSESGRTIGFDNNGKSHLNALKNIDSFLNKAQAEKKRYDYVIVCLGTNDTKKVFCQKQQEIPQNLCSLLAKIKQHKLCKGNKTQFIYVTPPPIREEGVSAKYQGSGKRLMHLIPELKNAALSQGFDIVDIHTPLIGILDYYAEDGVHMVEDGQEIIASRIVQSISQ